MSFRLAPLKQFSKRFGYGMWDANTKNYVLNTECKFDDSYDFSWNISPVLSTGEEQEKRAWGIYANVSKQKKTGMRWWYVKMEKCYIKHKWGTTCVV